MKLEKELSQKQFNNIYHKLALNIMFSNNWIMEGQTKILKPYQFTQPQYNVLRILRGSYPTPLTINSIIDRMLDRMSNVSRLVDKLVEKGYVDRTQSTDDRRAVDIVIMKKGLDILAEIDKKQEKWEANFTTISEDEAKQINNLLDKMREK
jgi:MarR family transcriptional regulator, 2-MHQ and catechol-resistance regulon repressor